MATVPLSPNLYDSNGAFSQARWLEYWSALWSAPSQPGYAIVVREGLASLRSLAVKLRGIAESVGAGEDWAGGDNPIELLDGAIGQLPAYSAIAAATNDGSVLRTAVVLPLLSEGQGPLLKIGRAAAALAKFEPPRPWSQIFKEEVFEPVKTAAAAVGGGLLRGVAPILAIGLVIYLVVTSKEGTQGE
jgi:hypothetical protein